MKHLISTTPSTKVGGSEAYSAAALQGPTVHNYYGIPPSFLPNQRPTTPTEMPRKRLQDFTPPLPKRPYNFSSSPSHWSEDSGSILREYFDYMRRIHRTRTSELDSTYNSLDNECYDIQGLKSLVPEDWKRLEIPEGLGLLLGRSIQAFWRYRKQNGAISSSSYEYGKTPHEFMSGANASGIKPIQITTGKDLGTSNDTQIDTDIHCANILRSSPPRPSQMGNIDFQPVNQEDIETPAED